ncbi:MAG: hypothetical protein JWM71_318 [Solirubrobacteraceae bacterium]|nr:hypothetical protein [Solirubrobacteraceae bacterium]
MLRGVPPFRAAVLAALTILVPAAPAAAAGDPIMPLSQVQRGMQCTGYSVIRGTDIVSFDAVVDDVVTDASNTADILITVSGPAVDATGVGPGFSGSPIYCPSPSDGTPEVAGAVSLGIGDYDNKTLLATPIESILSEPISPPSSARRAPRMLRRARPLSLPLSISGLAPRVADVFAAAGQRAGRTVYAAPSAPRADFPVQTLKPGSAMAVGYSSGDISSGAIGTVTYVDGNSIWAFGHPLDSVGRRALFLEDAYVYGIINSPSVAGGGTYKLAAPGHDIGTLSGDGIFAVTGTVGALPPSFPLVVNATNLDTGAKQQLNVNLADERGVGNPTGFEPLGFVGSGAVAQAAYSILQGSPINESGDMCVAIRVRERANPMGFCNTYVATGSGSATDGSSALAGAAPVGDFGSAAGLLDSYKLGPLHVTGVDVTMRLRNGLAQAFMTKLTGPKAVRRGRNYPVHLTIRRPGGARSVVTFRVHAPLGMTTGKRDLVLTGTPSDLAGGAGLSSLLTSLFGSASGSVDEAGPPTIGALAKQIGALHRYDGVTASFRPRHKKSEGLGSATADDALPGGAEGRALRERRVYRNPNLRLSGAVSIPVVVR